MLIYLTDLKQMPNWNKEETTLETIFHYEVAKGYSDIHSLRLFGLYKDESRDIRHNVYHPMDYVSHDVRIIVGEFDCLEKDKPDNTHVVKEIDRSGNTSILKVDFPILKNRHKGHNQDEYVNEVFEKLKKDERVLFCYVSPSGKGIRFGFKVNHRIHNDLEYVSNYYFYGKEFLKYDTRGRLGLDFNDSRTGSFYELANVASVYWFLPVTDNWHVKESIELKKI
jgi:hypothetical protein